MGVKNKATVKLYSKKLVLRFSPCSNSARSGSKTCDSEGFSQWFLLDIKLKLKLKYAEGINLTPPL